MSKSVSNFLLKRRSVTAKTMLASDVTNEDLDMIISSGLRVPDHGALSPWKIIIFNGKSRETFGKLFLGKRFKELNPSASKDDVIYEEKRFLEQVLLFVLSVHLFLITKFQYGKCNFRLQQYAKTYYCVHNHWAMLPSGLQNGILTMKLLPKN